MKKTQTQKDYEKLFALSKHARVLQGIHSLLDWDSETYMPEGAASIRAEQLKTLSGVIHREKTGKKWTHALKKLIDIESGQWIPLDLQEEQKAALREWRKDYLQDTTLPSKFVETFAKTTSEAIVIWRRARADNDFASFAPYLEKIVTLCRQKADFLKYKHHPYDALLDQYEPDINTQEVSLLFTSLKQEIIPLIKKAQENWVDDSFLEGSFDTQKQLAFSHRILSAMGYDLHYGRLDLSTHPFSSASHPTDSRITTRFHPTNLMSNIMTTLHEAGHALYEMGLPIKHYGSPLGDARSYGVHESQSRFWETRIGLSQPFWQHFFPLLQETFKDALQNVSFTQFYCAINKVEPSFIRVEADELTYPLHIILRFELEKELINGSLRVSDIPEAWNTKMKDYLGIVPQKTSEGCLQDIHWAMGGFGYFPSYTLGNLYAASLFDAFAKEHQEWEQKVASGQLDFIRAWLHDKIYIHGRRYPTKELLKKATGQDFSSVPYITYLKSKFFTIH